MPTDDVDGQRVTWYSGPPHRVFPRQSFSYDEQSFVLVVRQQMLTVRGEWWPNGRTSFTRGYMPPQPSLPEHDESAEHLCQRIVASAKRAKEKRAKLRASLESCSIGTPNDQPASVSRPRRESKASSSGSPRKLSPSAPSRQSPAKRASGQRASSKALPPLPPPPPPLPVVPATNAWNARPSSQSAAIGSSAGFPALTRSARSTQSQTRAATSKTTAATTTTTTTTTFTTATLAFANMEVDEEDGEEEGGDGGEEADGEEEGAEEEGEEGEEEGEEGEEEGEEEAGGLWGHVMRPRTKTGSESDDEVWEDEMQSKVGQLRGLLRFLDPFYDSTELYSGTVHAEDERELECIEKARGVSMKMKVGVLAETCAVLASLQKPDYDYVRAGVLIARPLTYALWLGCPLTPPLL